MTEILFEDRDYVICKKMPGEISEESNSAESLPYMLKKQLNSEIYTLHRLDKPVGGVIVYAKNKKAAAAFSALITSNRFAKTYLAVTDGIPAEDEGEFTDLLFKDSRKNKTFVVKKMRKGVKDASLTYTTQSKADSKALVKIRLKTGRSHQIRVQFASRKMPLAGDGKYGSRDNKCNIALWSHIAEFEHPFTKEQIKIESYPDMGEYPWNIFR